MFEQAVQRAITKLEGIFASKYKLGHEVGQIIAGLTITAPAIHYLNKQLHGGQTKQVKLTKKQDLHVDQHKVVNVSGHGTLVAAIYHGDDGGWYKWADGRWFSWNGRDWA